MKKYIKNNTVIVEVNGGVAYTSHSPENIECLIIDYDTLDSGACPLCGYDFSSDLPFNDDDTFCPECNIEWKDFKLEDILE